MDASLPKMQIAQIKLKTREYRAYKVGHKIQAKIEVIDQLTNCQNA